MTDTVTLSEGHHMFEKFEERMKSKDWAKLLLENRDTVLMDGRIRQLKAKNLGSGIVVVSKAPIKP